MRYVAKFTTPTARELMRLHMTINDRDWRQFPRGTAFFQYFRARYAHPETWEVEVAISDDVDGTLRDYGLYHESNFSDLIPDDIAVVETE